MLSAHHFVVCGVPVAGMTAGVAHSRQLDIRQPFSLPAVRASRFPAARLSVFSSLVIFLFTFYVKYGGSKRWTG
jgi:hypothetical protein